MDKTAIARRGIERLDERYWFNATRKRLAAAEETLAQLDQLAPETTDFLRKASQQLNEEDKVKVYRAGLECVAGSLFPIPVLAVAVTKACPQANDAVLKLHPDPLAPKIKDEPKAVEVLGRLPQDPVERARAAGQGRLEGLSPKARLECDRELARLSASGLLDHASTLSLDHRTLEKGLARAGQSELKIGAAMVENRAEAALVDLTRPHLPPEWASLVASLEPQAEDVKERIQLAASAIHLAARDEDQSALKLAGAMEFVSEPLARAILQEIPPSPEGAAWHEQASLLKLSAQDELQGTLRLPESSVAELVDEQLQQTDDPSLAAILLGEARRKADDPQQQAWLAGLEASQGGRLALQAGLGQTPTNVSQLFEAIRPMLDESDNPLDVLSQALPHWGSLAANPGEQKKLDLLLTACTGERYEPSTLWNGVSHAMEEPDQNLAAFSSNLISPMRFWMDADRVGAEACKAIEAQATADKDRSLAKAARFLYELQDGLEEEHERHGVLSEGLEWLGENAPSPSRWGELARALRHQTDNKLTDLVTARLASRYLQAESDPRLSQQGRFLEAVASMRSENLSERMEGVYEGLDRIGSQSTLPYVASGVADHFSESALERQKVAVLCFEEMGKTREDRPQAMASLLMGLARQDPELAYELLQGFDDPELEIDPAWLGQHAAQAVASHEGLDPTPLLDGLNRVAAAWGDRKLIPPAVERARQTGDLEELAEQLGKFQGDGYWLVSAAQGQENSSQVAERADHVIIGGVTVRKNQEE